MRFAAAITKDTDSCIGITIPDLPGCFSAGATLDEAMNNAKQAISSHLELKAENGEFSHAANPVDDHAIKPEFAGVTWALIEVDTSAFLGKTEKVSVSLPTLLTLKIDELVVSGAIKNRSAFLADSAIAALDKY